MIYHEQVQLTKGDLKALRAMWECCASLSMIGDMRGARHISKSILFKYSPPDFEYKTCVACGHIDSKRQEAPLHFDWCALHPELGEAQEMEELKKLFGVR